MNRGGAVTDWIEIEENGEFVEDREFLKKQKENLWSIDLLDIIQSATNQE